MRLCVLSVESSVVRPFCRASVVPSFDVVYCVGPSPIRLLAHTHMHVCMYVYMQLLSLFG